MRSFCLVLALLFLFPCLAYGAINPDEILKDPALNARARVLWNEIRCPVCESQNISGSDSDVAADLRALVNERLLAGDTDAQILGDLQERYGDVILMNPPVKDTTYVLWYAPLALIALGVAAVGFTIRKAAKA